MHEEIEIICEDQRLISGTIYKPNTLKGAVMIAPATGINQKFYTHFASFLKENGFGVITFDNRGIGNSKSKKNSDSDIDLISWGRQDMVAVLKHLKKEFPQTKYHLIGHSAGGQLAGLMPNWEELSSIFNYACSSGQLRNMKYPFKFSAHFFMNVYIPLNNLLFGKTNSQWVGMGDTLPKHVARQWSKWCNGQGYIKTDFGKAVKEHYYNDLNLPSKWLYATDDNIANLANVEDMISVFTKSKTEILRLDPDELGFEDIGHMKFFSRKRNSLWNIAIDWLELHS